MADGPVDTVILIHQIVGYPTAFVIAPIGLLAFTRSDLHRRWGKFYLYGMFFLYTTGTFLTFMLNDWTSWGFYRNLAFNFFGFSMLLYAWRAIWLFARPGGDVALARLDRGMAWVLTGSVLALVIVGAWHDIPMAVFAIVGAVLAFMEWRDMRGGTLSKQVLYRRHQRYILASYFYVLTVVSLVHLDDELPRNVKWLWPTVAGALTIWLVTVPPRRGQGWLYMPFPSVPRGLLLRYVVRAVVVLAVLYGSYAIYDLIYGRTILST